MVRGYEIPPFYWLCLCQTAVKDTCITLNAPNIHFLVQGLLPTQWQGYPLCRYLDFGVLILSPSATTAVLGFKWRNHDLTLVFCTWQHSSNYKRNMLQDHQGKRTRREHQRKEQKVCKEVRQRKCLSFRKNTIIVQGKLPFFT